MRLRRETGKPARDAQAGGGKNRRRSGPGRKSLAGKHSGLWPRGTRWETPMKWVLLALAILGIAASSLALREKYRPYGESPCDINERWDCGIVNHRPYAEIQGIPVAVIGIA